MSVDGLLGGHVYGGHRGGVRWSEATFAVRRRLFLLRRRIQRGGARKRGRVGAHPSRQAQAEEAQEKAVATVPVGARTTAAWRVRCFRSLLSSGSIAEHQRERGFRRWRIRRPSAATVAPQRMHANVQRWQQSRSARLVGLTVRLVGLGARFARARSSDGRVGRGRQPQLRRQLEQICQTVPPQLCKAAVPLVLGDDSIRSLR